MMQLIPTLLLLLLTTLGLKHFFADDLTLYIHPRYVWFTVLMGALGTIVLFVGTILALKQRRLTFAPNKKHSSFITLTAAVIILAGWLLPPQPLLSNTVQQRYTPAFSQNDTSVCLPISSEQPPETFQEWDKLLNICNDPLAYRDQPIALVGFVYDAPPTSTDDTFALARFLVSCCAVDAQPILLRVQQEDWRSWLSANDWVRIEGTVQPHRINDTLRAVIVPDTIEKISEPERPYEFIQL